MKLIIIYYEITQQSIVFIMSDTLAVLRDYNSFQHHQMKNSLQYSQLTGKQPLEKLDNLKGLSHPSKMSSHLEEK